MGTLDHDEIPRPTHDLSACSIPPDDLLDFAGNLARFQPENVLVFTGIRNRTGNPAPA